MGVKLFIKNFHYLRKQYGLTQEQMGLKLGVKRSTYAHWESYGTSIPPYPELIEILNEFGYTIEFLMTNDLETGTEYTPKIEANKENITIHENSTLPIHFNYVLRKLRNVKQRLIL